ncbi:unnamed protein product [Rotaria magnacalcarata]|uniref:Uncharacterized protein n=1 Tax=Rotaria magnacalcarata TaxID=392030 RepID=A0A820ID08_9BILA|nr:unnamed protein product [Rotaria magnacalcarata]
MMDGITVDTMIDLDDASGLPLPMLLAYIIIFYGQHRDLISRPSIAYNSKGVLEIKHYYDPDIDTLPNVSNEPMEQRHYELLIPRPLFSDEEKLVVIKERFQSWWQTYYAHKPQLKRINIKILRQPSSLIRSSDILSNRRPPIRL